DGATLGLVMGIQTYFCGYYAVFTTLMVGFAALVMISRGLWKDVHFWKAIGIVAAVALATALPLVAAYALHQRATGFARSLPGAGEFSASWRDYLASASYAHAPLLAVAGHRPTADMLFPGFVALLFGGAGALTAWRAGGAAREAAMVYGGMAVTACW